MESPTRSIKIVSSSFRVKLLNPPRWQLIHLETDFITSFEGIIERETVISLDHSLSIHSIILAFPIVAFFPKCIAPNA
jgi:hypothetical protein